MHGKNDTVVPLLQSERMYNALRDESKDVTFVKLEGEDHYLSKGTTRTEALKAIARFIDANIAE